MESTDKYTITSLYGLYNPSEQLQDERQISFSKKVKKKAKLNTILIIQRLLGIILIALNIGIVIILKDITAALIFVPMAILLIVTSDEIIDLEI